jgi:hypothetical protein
MKKILNVKTIGLVIILFLLVLLYVSKMIYTYRLPVVTGTIPLNGKLNKRETANGFANFENRIGLYIENEGKIETVFVKDGEMVKKDQALFSMSFDRDEQDQSLKELQIEFDYSMKQIEREIKTAEQYFERIKPLHNAGGISKTEYEEAQSNLENLITKRNEHIELFQTKKSSLEKKLFSFDKNIIFYSPENGKLINFNVKSGQTLLDNEYIGEIGFGNSFEIECALSIENNFTLVGDACKIKNVNHSFSGIVSNIKLSQNKKIVTVLVESEHISLGETFDLTFEKESTESYTLVPNGALNMDNEGYFLYQIKRRNGIIGKEFYAQKLRVYIGDSDDEYTAITKGISFFEPVSLYSDKIFHEGQTICLANEGDFFEN